MASKREMSEPESEPELENESGSEFEPAHEIQVDIKPTPSKKTKTQPKTQPKTPGSSQKKRPASSPHSGSGESIDSPSPTKKVNRVADGAKRTIAEKVIQSGIIAVDVAELATITGLTIRQVRSQLEGNRSNVRKQLMDLARGL